MMRLKDKVTNSFRVVAVGAVYRVPGFAEFGQCAISGPWGVPYG